MSVDSYNKMELKTFSVVKLVHDEVRFSLGASDSSSGELWLG